MQTVKNRQTGRKYNCGRNFTNKYRLHTGTLFDTIIDYMDGLSSILRHPHIMAKV